MDGMRQLQIIGDRARGRWLAWQWDDGRVGVEAINTTAALTLLAEALPRPAQDLGALGFDGALARPDLEPRLALALSGALIPEALRRQIGEAADGGPWSSTWPPPGRYAQVPWGLLSLDDERRLLDVADVSWIGPTLPRDLSPGSLPGARTVGSGPGAALAACSRSLSSRGQEDPSSTRRARGGGGDLGAAHSPANCGGSGPASARGLCLCS